MEKADRWKIFTESGKIEDYLSYRACCENEGESYDDHRKGNDTSKSEFIGGRQASHHFYR